MTATHLDEFPPAGDATAASGTSADAATGGEVLLVGAERGRARVLVGAATLVTLAALLGAVGMMVFGPQAEVETLETTSIEPALQPALGETIFVHVSGAVVRPGLYELSEGSRVLDAVFAAGGFSEQAQRDALNLARKMVDGEALKVLAIGEEPLQAETGAGAVGGLVNLNTASVAELETLPRIGPATAKRIIDFRRQHGPFKSVEDLLAVSGIGTKTLEGFRELVTV